MNFDRLFYNEINFIHKIKRPKGYPNYRKAVAQAEHDKEVHLPTAVIAAVPFDESILNEILN